MTDMEKKVMVWLCAKILTETELYDTDLEVRNLIDWICMSEQIKENNNTIRNLTREYKKVEPDCREGVRAQLERMKELCKERNKLYENQNDLKGQKWKIEKEILVDYKEKTTITLNELIPDWWGKGQMNANCDL